MGLHNGFQIIKAPDIDGIITIDMDADGIATQGGAIANVVQVLIDGAEVKGVRLTVNDGAEDYEPSDEADVTWFVFKPRTTPVIFRHLSGDVPSGQRILIEGTPGGVDSWLINATHFAGFVWSEAEEMFLFTISLWQEYVP